MIEDQGTTVDFHTVRNLAGGPAMSQIPGRDVVLGVANDCDVVEQGRGKVNPAPIGEEPRRDIVVTEAAQPVGPPVDKLPPLPGHPNGEEPEIVNTVP